MFFPVRVAETSRNNQRHENNFYHREVMDQ